jgi:hypothetical protein
MCQIPGPPPQLLRIGMRANSMGKSRFQGAAPTAVNVRVMSVGTTPIFEVGLGLIGLLRCNPLSRHQRSDLRDRYTGSSPLVLCADDAALSNTETARMMEILSVGCVICFPGLSHRWHQKRGRR